MKQAFVFQPDRLPGTLFHAGAILLLLAGAGWGIWQAGRAEIGTAFLLALLPLLLAGSLTPLLIYQGFALRSAGYTLERDGIRLRWGLRHVVIPIDAVLWMRQAREMSETIPLPWLRWPGSLAGIRKLPGGGLIEYMAGDRQHLVLIATATTIYAISPQNPSEFIETYQRLNELGSLTPLPAQSIYPGFLIARLWRAPLARELILGGAFLNLVLLAWISLAVPGRGRVILGFIAGSEEVPAVRMLLLSILSSFFFLADFFIGLIFFRRGEAQAPASSEKLQAQALAYLLWGSGVLTCILYLFGTFFILQNR